MRSGSSGARSMTLRGAVAAQSDRIPGADPGLPAELAERTRRSRDDRHRAGLRAGDAPDVPRMRRAVPARAPPTRAWSASVRWRSATTSVAPTRAEHRGRPAEHVALPRPAARPRATSPSSPACTPGSPSWSGPTTWPASSGCAGSGSRTTPATRRTRSRTGSSPSPCPRPASSGLQHAVVRLDRQPGQRGRRRRRPRRDGPRRGDPERTSRRARSSRPPSTTAR